MIKRIIILIFAVVFVCNAQIEDKKKEVIKIHETTPIVKTGFYARTNRNIVASLRIKPEFGSKVLCKIPKYSIIKITDYSGFYWKAEYKNHIGYIANSYVIQSQNIKDIINSYNYKKSKPASEIMNKKREIELVKGWIADYEVKIFEAPDISSKTVYTLHRGEIVFIQETKGNWIKVCRGGPGKRYIGDYNINRLLLDYEFGWIEKNYISYNRIPRISVAELRR